MATRTRPGIPEPVGGKTAPATPVAGWEAATQEDQGRMAEGRSAGGPRDPVRIGGCLVRAGTTSWADRGLVRDGTFYPRKTMTARERLAYYARRLPLAEISTTYRFPPTPELCAQWAERTPVGFSFDLRAWSLLTGCPTLPDSLWPDLHQEVRPAHRDGRRLYPQHLSSDGLEECWARFAHAVRPLADSGRLGAVVLRYPSWAGPRPETIEELVRLPERLPGLPLAVELRNPKWLAGAVADDTFELLEAHGLGFVCVDGPDRGAAGGEEGSSLPQAGASFPAAVAATTDVGVVRFEGRRSVEGEPWTWPYRYAEEELSGWLPAVLALAQSSREVHLVFDNGPGADAVANALAMLDAVAETARRVA
ncbi:MAG TPA: DUF72 domain-containing protein [Acidimicrobiales bacterium]|nr:DUF72 domain-containing protein [Acidimicrobiales bacterium]